MAQYRLLRVIEYTGTAEQLVNFINQRAVKGTYKLANGAVIREAILGESAEILSASDEKIDDPT